MIHFDPASGRLGSLAPRDPEHAQNRANPEFRGFAGVEG